MHGYWPFSARVTASTRFVVVRSGRILSVCNRHHYAKQTASYHKFLLEEGNRALHQTGPFLVSQLSRIGLQ
jgi:hypothetical protein